MGTLVPIKNPLSTNGAVLYHITANRLITLKTVHMICHQRKGAMLRGEGGRKGGMNGILLHTIAIQLKQNLSLPNP